MDIVTILEAAEGPYRIELFLDDANDLNKWIDQHYAIDLGRDHPTLSGAIAHIKARLTGGLSWRILDPRGRVMTGEINAKDYQKFGDRLLSNPVVRGVPAA